MTEEQLLADSEFIGFCNRWKEDRHCPLPFADWCLENVGELAFDACVWAHEKEQRKGDKGMSRTRPLTIGVLFCWADIGIGPKDAFWNDVPLTDFKDCSTFPAAIAYYLFHFDRELAAKYPPKALKAV